MNKNLPYLDTGILMPHVFHTHAIDVLKKIMLFAHHQGVSDVFIQANQPIIVALQGRLHAITPRHLDANEVWNLLMMITERPTAKTDVMAGRAVNSSYIVQDERQHTEYKEKQRYYYRVNATGIQLGSGEDTVQIVMRTIPTTPPLAKSLAIDDAILNHIAPKNGLVLIAGATGSGKTTTFASFIRHILENNTPIQGNIVTYEAPIEFRFDHIQSAHSIITQTEIPKHLPTFFDGVKQAMRRKPELIMIGELRDEETILAAIEASLTGHAVYGTVHANDVTSIFTRLLYRLPEGERVQAIYKIVDAMRFCLAQRVIPSVDGKRVALRAYLTFDHDLIDALLKIEDVTQISLAIKQAIKEKGQTFIAHANFLYQEGKIEQSTFMQLCKELN